MSNCFGFWILMPYRHFITINFIITGTSTKKHCIRHTYIIRIRVKCTCHYIKCIIVYFIEPSPFRRASYRAIIGQSHPICTVIQMILTRRRSNGHLEIIIKNLHTLSTENINPRTNFRLKTIFKNLQTISRCRDTIMIRNRLSIGKKITINQRTLTF
ncbi:hypothetical protein D3C86_1739250 [compost metagenome]